METTIAGFPISTMDPTVIVAIVFGILGGTAIVMLVMLELYMIYKTK